MVHAQEAVPDVPEAALAAAQAALVVAALDVLEIVVAAAELDV